MGVQHFGTHPMLWFVIGSILYIHVKFHYSVNPTKPAFVDGYILIKNHIPLYHHLLMINDVPIKSQ